MFLMPKRKYNKDHKKAYIKHFGSIPKGYHVHHIDGDHTNNDPSNLTAVSIREHFDIHWNQGDWGACWALMKTGHLDLTPEERSEVSRRQLSYQWKNNREKMMNARHNRDDSCLLGRTWTLNEEQRKKITAHLVPFDKDTAKICKDTIWINDGVKNKRIKSTQVIPEGFAEGRLFTPWNKGKKKNV
jgi:hypothetical protein